jgi:hypothetical protein
MFLAPSSPERPPGLKRRAEASAAKSAAMPLQLTDYELETIARACRALAHREGEDAAKISDPALRTPVQERAQCAEVLAERFERARKRGEQTR